MFKCPQVMSLAGNTAAASSACNAAAASACNAAAAAATSAAAAATSLEND